MITREKNRLKKIEITSPFWKQYRELIVDEVLPYQWEVMNDSADINITHEPGGNDEHQEHSHAIQNLEIAAGLKKGTHNGYTFQDTDVYKWLEAAAYSLRYQPNEELQTITDRLIDLIEEAQEEDGYLVTFFQIEAPERKFARLKQSHELYTMGHYMEAAVAYYDVTQNQKALSIAIKMADCLVEHFGHGADQIPGYDGHPEIELALARLYEATEKQAYLTLAEFFINERGQDDFFDRQIQKDGFERDLIDGMRNFPLSYYQAAEPVREQETAEGHAVRVVYLCTGMAQVARLTGDKSLLATCQRFWNNIVKQKMYITGGIGSTNIGEAFTGNYDLPNDTMYGETCASVGMAFFAQEMLKLETKGEYGDVLEKELFNGIISGISLDGTHFFYVNPLQADQEISSHNPSREHVLNKRAEWFGCACCPSNVARLIASVDRYIYTVKDETILSHQFISNMATFENGITIQQTSNYPWEGMVSYTIENNSAEAQQIGIRIPEWSQKKAQLLIDGVEKRLQVIDGFVYLEIPTGTTTLQLTLDMSVKKYQANEKVVYNFGKVAIQRGPLVYCVEETDQTTDVWKYTLTKEGQFRYAFEADLLGGVGAIYADAQLPETAHTDALYQEYRTPQFKETQVKLIPYYAWANRTSENMEVWINQQ
ncbi:glycoside hydrolase family 127 protein [Enterococcus devriesei]|uniref:glycoside hydrolase family 127 protein n=1 Tax=Enterococcus devriesei TaxID=319970 RepID=UPI001C1221E5|nr:beta-L-arabinofuranosidase domain-containing protein [Enterococcus devriesei]MBU5365831.1 glycoside hydrolase family 127 protein [Enterococcus devriesei]